MQTKLASGHTSITKTHVTPSYGERVLLGIIFITKDMKFLSWHIIKILCAYDEVPFLTYDEGPGTSLITLMHSGEHNTTRTSDKSVRQTVCPPLAKVP